MKLLNLWLIYALHSVECKLTHCMSKLSVKYRCENCANTPVVKYRGQSCFVNCANALSVCETGSQLCILDVKLDERCFTMDPNNEEES